jgi:hypothetical protein
VDPSQNGGSTKIAASWIAVSTHFFGNFAVTVGLNPRNNRRNSSVMGKKWFVMALAVLAFAFGTALRSNAGTDMIEPYQAPAQNYNYAPPPPPPPRPVLFVPPVRIGVFFGPGFGYGYYGPRYGYHGAHRFYGRPGYWHGRYHRWH